MYELNEKIKLNRGWYATILKKFTEFSYIVELREINDSGKVINTGSKIVTNIELESKNVWLEPYQPFKSNKYSNGKRHG